MGTLRAGILGLGGIAHKHAQAIAELKDDIELVALCGRSEARARAFAEQEGIARAALFTTHHAMLEQADLDMMVVCLPPFAHSDEIALAAERGVDVLVEKPIAMSSTQAWQMVDTAERAGIKTQVGFMYRFGLAVNEFRERVPPGTAGLFSARYFCNSLHAPWWRRRDYSGGQVVEQAIHLFDIMRFLVGEPVSVYSRQANFFHRDVPDYDVEDVSATVMGFSNGALAVIYATNGAVPNRWVKEWRIVAPGVIAEFQDWNHATFTPTDAPDRAPQVIASEENVFRLQLQDLVNAIRTGGQTRAPLREGAKSLDLVLAARRSAETRTEVDLNGTVTPSSHPGEGT